MGENQTEGKLRVIDDIYSHPVFKELYASLPDHLKPMVDEHVKSLTTKVDGIKENIRNNIINQGLAMDFVKTADEALCKVFYDKASPDEMGEE